MFEGPQLPPIYKGVQLKIYCLNLTLKYDILLLCGILGGVSIGIFAVEPSYVRLWSHIMLGIGETKLISFLRQWRSCHLGFTSTIYHSNEIHLILESQLICHDLVSGFELCWVLHFEINENNRINWYARYWVQGYVQIVTAFVGKLGIWIFIFKDKCIIPASLSRYQTWTLHSLINISLCIIIVLINILLYYF